MSILVHLVNEGASEVEVTLTIGGILLSGVLTSVGRYLDDLAAWLEPRGDETLANYLRERRAEADAARARGEVDLDYFYLRNVRFVVPGAATTIRGTAPWRGRVAAVDGWSLGSVA